MSQAKARELRRETKRTLGHHLEAFVHGERARIDLLQKETQALLAAVTDLSSAHANLKDEHATRKRDAETLTLRVDSLAMTSTVRDLSFRRRLRWLFLGH